MRISMYDPDMTSPMREELTSNGIQDLRTPEDVDKALKTKDNIFVIVNSVCGCGAGSARPGIILALKNKKLPKMVTVFAGVDYEAVDKARSYFPEYPPTSPSFFLLKNNKVLFAMQRQDILGKPPELVAEIVTEAFNKFL